MIEKKLNWSKLGLLYSPNRNSEWARQYAQVPRGFQDNGALKILFATRGEADENNNFVSRVGGVTITENEVLQVSNISKEPILSNGKEGAFDHYGVMPGSLNWMNEDLYLYYTGWTRKVDVPYSTCIGLAKSQDKGKTFTRVSEGPLLGLCQKDPYLINGPFVFKSNDHWHMWYASGTQWFKSNQQWECHYNIRHATSLDGLSWRKSSGACVPEVLKNECQNAPVVFEFQGKYHMYFCFRHSTDFRNKRRGYRLGYAYSEDLQQWIRDDSLAGIELSENGWDSEMMCYPWIEKTEQKIYLFYCGNHFGRDGFGAAELQL